jgi:hypothetical protein
VDKFFIYVLFLKNTGFDFQGFTKISFPKFIYYLAVSQGFIKKNKKQMRVEKNV